MKIKSDSYVLTNIGENYDRVATALRGEAMIHSVVGNREQFYMPGGKVTLQLRYHGRKKFLDVTRTSLRQPKYVRNLIEQLGGKWSGSFEGSPGDSLDILLRNLEADKQEQ